MTLRNGLQIKATASLDGQHWRKNCVGVIGREAVSTYCNKNHESYKGDVRFYYLLNVFMAIVWKVFFSSHLKDFDIPVDCLAWCCGFSLTIIKSLSSSVHWTGILSRKRNHNLYVNQMIRNRFLGRLESSGLHSTRILANSPQRQRITA